MMFAYLSIFKIMGGLFYTGETNSKKARINFSVPTRDGGNRGNRSLLFFIRKMMTLDLVVERRRGGGPGRFAETLVPPRAPGASACVVVSDAHDASH